MIQTGFQIKKIGEFLKEYLSILIIVPAFIGGIWQAIELMTIYYSYIRFFSISQIVPDGIVVIMSIIVFSFIIFLIYLIELIDGESKQEYAIRVNNSEKFIKRNESTFIFIFLYISVMVFPFIFISFETPTLKDLRFLALMMFFITYYLNDSLAKSYYSALDKNKKYYKYCNLLLLVYYSTYIFFFSVCIHHTFLLPRDNINIEQVKKDVANKFPNTNQQLLYFNDKYIFIKITGKPIKDKKGKLIKSKTDKVYITKLDDLFKN
jgi:hypothetical protein